MLLQVMEIRPTTSSNTLNLGPDSNSELQKENFAEHIQQVTRKNRDCRCRDSGIKPITYWICFVDGKLAYRREIRNEID